MKSKSFSNMGFIKTGINRESTARTFPLWSQKITASPILLFCFGEASKLTLITFSAGLFSALRSLIFPLHNMVVWNQKRLGLLQSILKRKFLSIEHPLVPFIPYNPNKFTDPSQKICITNLRATHYPSNKRRIILGLDSSP